MENGVRTSAQADRNEKLRAIEAANCLLGPAGVVAEPGLMSRYLADWSGDHRGQALVVLRPASVAEVCETVRLCRAHGLAIVPQGGNTGLAGGAFASDGPPCAILSLERLAAVRSIDAESYTMRVDAGVTLQQVRDAAEAVDRLFPLSLGAQGSCQIGGNAATNAGGVNVVRHGMARDLILGLEVVLPDGALWSGMSGLRKDNRGYDLKQLFIGSEGTLGIITGVELKLFPLPRRTETAYLGLRSFADAMELFARARQTCSDLISAFEVIGAECIPMARLIDPDLVLPVSADLPVHVLLECSSSEAIDLRALVETLLAEAMEAGLVAEAVLATSGAQARAFWGIREGLVEGQAKQGFHVRTDLSVRLSQVPALIERARAHVAAHHPGWRPLAYGHAGDGNVHFNALPPVGLDPARARAEGAALSHGLYALIDAMGGSVSAEHGVGRTRRDIVWPALTDAHRRLVMTLKAALDPDNIMNPGCLIPSTEEPS